MDHVTTSNSSSEQLSIPFRVFCGLVLIFCFVLGLFGNLNALLLCRNQPFMLNQVTRWILINLAIFDLISSLINFPAIFLVVTVKLFRENVLQILSVTTLCVTLATFWGNCACLVVLAMVRRDAAVSAFCPQRVTIQRLKKLLIVIWLIYGLILWGIFHSYHDLSVVLWRPKTFRKMTVKKLPIGPVMIVITVLTTGYVLKCYYNIRSFLKTHHNAIEGQISAAQANFRREQERKLARVMLQVSIIFAVTVIPPSVIPFFLRSVSAEIFVMGRIAALVGQITNPFIYSTINRDFVRVLLCFKCQCLGRASNTSHNPDDAMKEEDIAAQGAAPNQQDFPMRLESVESAVSLPVSDSSRRNMDCMRGQQSYNSSLDNDEHAPSSHARAQSYIRSMYSGHGRWLRMQGEDLTPVDS